MSDLIKRSDAIAEICKARTPDVASHHYAELFINAVRRAPSADRPQGEWVKHDDERDYCSRCKRLFTTRAITKQDKWTTYVDDLGYNFCPNCGARMKGADDEID